MAGGTSGGSIERFEHEFWSQKKDFGLKKNTSSQVRGELCLDGADVVIDGMWLKQSVEFKSTNVKALAITKAQINGSTMKIGHLCARRPGASIAPL